MTKLKLIDPGFFSLPRISLSRISVDPTLVTDYWSRSRFSACFSPRTENQMRTVVLSLIARPRSSEIFSCSFGTIYLWSRNLAILQSDVFLLIHTNYFSFPIEIQLHQLSKISKILDLCNSVADKFWFYFVLL